MRTNARLKAGATKDNLELHRFEKKHDLHSNAAKNTSSCTNYMRLNRELEEQMVRLFRQNRQDRWRTLFQFGQEAISVGTAYALGPRLDRAHDPQYRRAAGARFQAARHSDAAHGALHFADTRQGWHQPFSAN